MISKVFYMLPKLQILLPMLDIPKMACEHVSDLEIILDDLEAILDDLKGVL